MSQPYKITNLIEIGEETFNMDDLPKERQMEIAKQLNRNALFAIGYRLKTEEPQ